MAVRKQHARASSNHIIFNHNNQRFYLEAGAFQLKSIIYSIKAKIVSGKLPILIDNPEDKIILIICSKAIDGGLKFDLI
jgi:hypothetical protein